MLRLRPWSTTGRTRYNNGITSRPWWQLRIDDCCLPASVHMLATSAALLTVSVAARAAATAASTARTAASAAMLVGTPALLDASSVQC